MRVLVALLAVAVVSGCTALVVGGGSSGGYQQSKDERPPSMVTADSAITTKIKGKYTADAVVSVFGIGVRTWRGSVTLNGAVGSFAARDQAERLAKETKGVKSVSNLIVVEDRSAPR